jgi:hypothetical protein
VAGGMDRRIGALEGLVERRVEEEIEAVLDLLGEHPPREEYERLLRLMAGQEEEGGRR